VTAAVGTTASTTALSASPNPVATGASVTLTATVTPTTTGQLRWELRR
jgi:hypothetical protein